MMPALCFVLTHTVRRGSRRFSAGVKVVWDRAIMRNAVFLLNKLALGYNIRFFSSYSDNGDNTDAFADKLPVYRRRVERPLVGLFDLHFAIADAPCRRNADAVASLDRPYWLIDYISSLPLDIGRLMQEVGEDTNSKVPPTCDWSRQRGRLETETEAPIGKPPLFPSQTWL